MRRVIVLGLLALAAAVVWLSSRPAHDASATAAWSTTDVAWPALGAAASRGLAAPPDETTLCSLPGVHRWTQRPRRRSDASAAV